MELFFSNSYNTLYLALDKQEIEWNKPIFLNAKMYLFKMPVMYNSYFCWFELNRLSSAPRSLAYSQTALDHDTGCQYISGEDF